MVLMFVGLFVGGPLACRGAQNKAADQNTSVASQVKADPAVSPVLANAIAVPMGPHMAMTPLLPEQPGDRERVAQVLADAKAFLTKYEDYRVAGADVFEPLEPEIKQANYHFTQRRGKQSWWAPVYAKTNPSDPNTGYRLVAVMHAGHNPLATKEQINRDIPLSQVQWHTHINYCQPPAGYKGEWLAANKKFGFNGSITTEAKCKAEGGTFFHNTGWMVHVHPFDPEPWLSALGDMDDDGNKGKPAKKMDPKMKMDPGMKMDPNMKM